MDKKDKYWQLFLSTLKLSACTFGGGFVIIPLMRERFVKELHWIEEEEMLDLTAIAQSSPGSIAINASILVGYHVAGIPGALITVVGAALPPLIIISVISVLYQAFRSNRYVSMAMAGMLAGVAAVIFDVVINMARPILKKKRLLPIAVMLAAFVATRFFSVNIILIILVCGGIGALDTLYLKKKEIEMIYLELFWSFFQVGLFSIGGGYAAMPLIQNQVVDIHPWLTMTGFADIITIAEMTPGPIAVNAATFVGIQVAGLPGALIATIGCIFPSCVIVMALAYMYYRFRGLSVMQGILAGLRPAVIAMIASAGISLLCMALYRQRTFPADLGSMDLIALAIFLMGFFVLRKWKPSYQGHGGGLPWPVSRCTVSRHKQKPERMYIQMKDILNCMEMEWLSIRADSLWRRAYQPDVCHHGNVRAGCKTLYPAKKSIPIHSKTRPA